MKRFLLAGAGVMVTGLLGYHLVGNIMKKQNKYTIFDTPQQVEDVHALFAQTPETLVHMSDQVIERTHAALEKIYAAMPEKRTFDNTMRVLDTVNDQLDRVISFMHMLEMVHPHETMRTALHEQAARLQKFSVDTLSLNKKIYRAVKEYAEYAGKIEQLSGQERYYLEESLKDFKKAGYELPEEQQDRLKVLYKELGDLSMNFERNISTDSRCVLVTREELAGIPDAQVAPWFQQETQKYCLQTDYPTMDSVMTQCRVESTRKALWAAFENRAYPHNMEVLKQVMEIRHEIATLLGYTSYAHCNIDDSMAKTPEAVQKFLENLESKSLEKAQREFKFLSQSLPESVMLIDGKLKPWDMRLVSSEYKKKYAAVDERAIAEYFPLENTIDALLDIYREFFGIDFTTITGATFWHPDVKLIRATEQGKLLGYLLLDLHPRPHKYTHACHGSIISARSDKEGNRTVPLISLVICNFPKSVGDQPALLMRSDVNTFFHEFGHAVHALCGATELAAFSGTNTKRDFVELPSQMLEEWLEQPEILKRISSHYKTGAPLPDELINAIVGIKNLSTGFFLTRQLGLSYISLDCYNSLVSEDKLARYAQLQQRTSPYRYYCDEEHMLASFGHLMGYGAQYYGYLWSKVYALDLFDTIKKGGLTSPEMGKRYRDLVLAQGGSKDPLELLKDFLGREPSIDAFIKDLGI